MSAFRIYPAIDLRQGKVVRLKQGDPQRQSTYSADPASVAERWLQAGAGWLHVVNLDGAFGEEDQQNQRALRQILKTAGNAGARVQFGGGMRSLKAVQKALDMNCARVIIGTLAVENPDLVEEAVNQFGVENVAVGIDALDGMIQVRGWRTGTTVTATRLARRLAALGLRWVIFTDVARDGIGAGLNLNATVELARQSGLSVIASGGVEHSEDVFNARQAGLEGVIIGRALYEGKIILQDVLGEERL